MPSMSETHEFIVVNDGSSRVGAHNERSVSSPASASSPFGDGEDGSQRRKSGRPGDSLDKLRALPKVREIPFYEGKELPADRSTESTRVQTRGACLLASRGEVQTPPCTHCASGVGRFSQCIALDDWFHGACATCQLATRGNLCSLRNRDTLRIKPEGASRSEESETFSSIPRQSPAVAQPESSQSPTFEQPSKLKRKRETLQGTSVFKPYVSPYLPAMPSGSIQSSLPNTPTIYSSTSALPRAPSPPKSFAPVNYIYQRENTHNGFKTPPAPAKEPIPSKKSIPSKKPRPSKEPAPVLAVQTSVPAETPLRGREATDSLSPSTQLLQPFEPDVQEKPQKSVQASSAKTNPRSRQTQPPDTPLIDTLSRKKQKQIYGIIGGLQSGIRSCQQQAESMQKQLNMLQEALGIEGDDENDLSVLD